VLAPDGTDITTAPIHRHIDNAMVKAVSRAFRWREMLENGDYTTRHSGHGRTCYRLDPVATDPKRTFGSDSDRLSLFAVLWKIRGVRRAFPSCSSAQTFPLYSSQNTPYTIHTDGNRMDS
jgi:hypothetical protein